MRITTTVYQTEKESCNTYNYLRNFMLDINLQQTFFKLGNKFSSLYLRTSNSSRILLIKSANTWNLAITKPAFYSLEQTISIIISTYLFTYIEESIRYIIYYVTTV